MICQSDWSTYLYQLQQYITAQSRKIQQLEQSIAKMQTEINQLKTKPSTNVEKIEYKFDQLKIETLEGTLNIGLNPSDLNSLDEFSVGQGGGINTPNMDNPKHAQFANQIRDKVNRFLDEDCPALLQNLERENNRSLGESYHQFIIEDVRKQIDHRITFYLNQYATQLEGNEGEYQEVIYQKVQADIEKSFTAFINNLPNDVKGGIFNEFHGH